MQVVLFDAGGCGVLGICQEHVDLLPQGCTCRSFGSPRNASRAPSCWRTTMHISPHSSRWSRQRTGMGRWAETGSRWPGVGRRTRAVGVGISAWAHLFGFYVGRNVPAVFVHRHGGHVFWSGGVGQLPPCSQVLPASRHQSADDSIPVGRHLDGLHGSTCFQLCIEFGFVWLTLGCRMAEENIPKGVRRGGWMGWTPPPPNPA